METELTNLVNSIPGDFIGTGPLPKSLWMANRIVRDSLKNCVEIGVWRGRSLAALAVGTKYTGGRSFGIDPYCQSNVYEKDAAKVIQDILQTIVPTIDMDQVYNRVVTIFKDYPVTLIRKPAVSAVNDVPSVLDFIHIDGNHDTQLVSADIQLYVPKVRSGGTIVMDDITWASVAKALPLLDRYAEKEVEMNGWGVWKRK